MNQITLIQALKKRKQLSLYRIRYPRESPQKTHIKVANQYYLNFCSNDYLGLASHPKLIQSFQKSVQKEGVGSGAANLITGYSVAHQQLESALAEWTGRESALLFSNGYLANLGIMTALIKRKDTLTQDQLNHASLLDAGILCRAKLQRYRHLNTNHLTAILDKSIQKNKFIATESIFSMNGDQAPLPQLAQIATMYQATLIVDDAHGIGVLGKHGAGSLSYHGLSQQEAPILMGTLGKAFGLIGAFVAGSTALIETLIQYARTYIYTTALPASIAETALVSLKIIQSESWRRHKLYDNITYFKTKMASLSIKLLPSNTAIQPLFIGEASTALQVAYFLKSQSILVSAIRPPTVPIDTSRLRITLSTEHTFQQIDQLVLALKAACEAYSIKTTDRLL
ncbi:MAG: 8-amino-7-oxononanoate synthase [Endozoicomonadaceae bacterium]|nr:8-amino-7-oxononanoate synthase [Endozoicomonadaceae bacterium]MBE8232606.1 8-amino-7-oxononanoate synthase [Endozoicomonadaceae bacterium]